MKNWSIYIIVCSDDSLYTGITTDIQRRFQQHLSHQGAKYFRGRQPVEIVFQKSGYTRSSASIEEARIKGLSRKDKLLLIETS